MGPHTTRDQPAHRGNRWGSPGAADETPTLNPHRSSRAPQALFDLTVDALKLADLQVQLLTIDVRRFWSSAWTSLLVMAAAAALLTAALPVAMFGCAEFLRQSLSISIEFALLLVSGIALGVACGAMVWCGLRLSVAAVPLRRSADELRENLTWMRGLLHDEEPAPPSSGADVR